MSTKFLTTTGPGHKYVPPVKATPKDDALDILGRIPKMIAECKNLDQTAVLKGLLDVAKRQARNKGLEDAEKEIIDYRYLLLEKDGQMLEAASKAGELAGRGQKGNLPNLVHLKDVGISPNEASKARKYAKLPAEEKEAVKNVEKAKVGRKRRKIIDGNRLGKITGKPLAGDHYHDFVYCDCGEKYSLAEATKKTV